jgi:hypothetical protein
MKTKLHPWRDAGKSLCQCGHTGDRPHSAHGGLLGHGPCFVPGCACLKFSWHSWAPWFRRLSLREQRALAKEMSGIVFTRRGRQ